MAKFKKGNSSFVGSYPDERITAYASALKEGERIDPRLKRIPLDTILGNILQEHRDDYGVDPFQIDPKSKDDRNKANMISKLSQLGGLDSRAVDAVAALSTNNQIAQRNKRNLLEVWNGGGSDNHAPAVMDVIQNMNMHPDLKKTVMDAFYKGYSPSMTESPAPESKAPSLIDLFRQKMRNFTGGGF